MTVKIRCTNCQTEDVFIVCDYTCDKCGKAMEYGSKLVSLNEEYDIGHYCFKCTQKFLDMKVK